MDLKEDEFVWCKAICKRSGIANLRRVKAWAVRAQYTSNLNTTDVGYGDYTVNTDEDDSEEPNHRKSNYSRPFIHKSKGTTI